MTGDINIDAALLVLAAILGALGSSFGWPALVRFADWIKARDEAAKAKLVPTEPTKLADTKELPALPKEPL